jgi:hypothetical protein
MMCMHRPQHRNLRRRALQILILDLLGISKKIINDRRDLRIGQAKRDPLSLSIRQCSALRQKEHPILIPTHNPAHRAHTLPLRCIIGLERTLLGKRIRRERGIGSPRSLRLRSRSTPNQSSESNKNKCGFHRLNPRVFVRHEPMRAQEPLIGSGQDQTVRVCIERSSSTGMWQWIAWPSPASRQGGASVSHIAPILRGQRV